MLMSQTDKYNNKINKKVRFINLYYVINQSFWSSVFWILPGHQISLHVWLQSFQELIVNQYVMCDT